MGKTKKTNKEDKAVDNLQHPKVSFKNSVRKCMDIKDALKSGLSALKANSKYVKVTNTKLLDGSVDIDEAVRDKYPEDSRWDYVVGYANEAFFIEVHPAATSNIDDMVKKVKWLKNWLASSAPDLKSLHKIEVYYWIPSGRVSILKGSVQDRKIAANHLQIKNPVIIQ